MEQVLETVTRTQSPLWKSDWSLSPSIQLIREIPKTLKSGSIESAVQAFVTESGAQGDPVGVYTQLLKTIANSVTYGGANHFWMAQDLDEVASIVVANITTDIDDRLTYWVNAAWVAPDFRGKPIVKEWWSDIKKHAKRNLCQHLVIVSSRNPEAYQRYLSRNLKPYATLLMEDL